ncbi:MAG: GNAT family N-acetyltransferase [Halobacteriaceae archaeon]
MRIEAAEQADVAALADLWVSLVADQRAYGAHLLAAANRERVREFLANFVATDSVVVARDAGIVGFVMFRIESGAYEQDATRGFVDNVFVRPARRGEGIGSRLLDAAEDALAERGADVAALSVLADNEDARRLYERRGYSPHRITMERPLESDTSSSVD